MPSKSNKAALFKCSLYAEVAADSVAVATEHGKKLTAELARQEGIVAVKQGEVAELKDADFETNPPRRFSYDPKHFAVVVDLVVREDNPMRAIRRSAQITAEWRSRADILDAHGIPMPVKITEQDLAEFSPLRAPTLKL